MKEYNCPDCKVTTDSCEGCQRMAEKISNDPTKQKKYDVYEDWKKYIGDVGLRYDYGYNYKCCQSCSNNPKNGGSGSCNCTLPYFEQSITGLPYNITTSTSTEKTIDIPVYLVL